MGIIIGKKKKGIIIGKKINKFTKVSSTYKTTNSDHQVKSEV